MSLLPLFVGWTRTRWLQSFSPCRPSSVPLPDSRFHPTPLSRSLPSLHAELRLSRSARMIIGQRCPSSALPHFGRMSWGVDNVPMFPAVSPHGFYSPPHPLLQHDESPLLEPDKSLFEATFLNSNFGFLAPSAEPAPTVRTCSLLFHVVLILPTDVQHHLFDHATTLGLWVCANGPHLTPRPLPLGC